MVSDGFTMVYTKRMQRRCKQLFSKCYNATSKCTMFPSNISNDSSPAPCINAVRSQTIPHSSPQANARTPFDVSVRPRCKPRQKLRNCPMLWISPQETCETLGKDNVSVQNWALVHFGDMVEAVHTETSWNCPTDWSKFQPSASTSLGPKTLQRKIQHGASSEEQKMSCPVMTNRGWDIIQSGTCLWSWVLNVPRKTSPHNFMKADDWRKESRRCAPIAIRYFWFDFDVFRTSNLCSSRTATLWSWCRSCHAQQLFRLGYISLLQLYTELSNCTIVTTTVVILTWCWRSAITHFQLNTWLQVKSWQVPRERSRLFHSVVSKPSYIVEHGHHFFHICTRNSSPLVTSLEQRHHPSFASALVSQDVGPYFATLVHTAPGPSVSILVRDQSSIITDLQNHQNSQYSRAWDSLLPWSHEGLDFPVSTSVLWQNLKSQALMQVR